MRKPDNRGKRFPLKTPQQRAALALITKALKSNKPFSITDLLIKAGYAEESARQLTNIMASLKPHIDPIVEKIEKHRDRILSRLDDDRVLNQASYGELIRGLHVTTQVSRLIGGKSTQNVAVQHERRAELEQLLAD